MSSKCPLPASTLSPAAPAIPLTPPAERIYPLAAPASKKPKKGEPAPEKRLRVFKKACPQATQERTDRVFSQRFFCVERNRTGELSEEFKVLGSTGNCYTVKIQHEPTCDCPDGAKGNKCKHQLFVLLKILQVPQSSNLWYQSALLTPELRAIFANARPAPRTQVEERIANAYKVATGKAKAEDVEGELGGVKKRVPQEGDTCPICYEDFEPNSESGLVFCLSPSGCGNALHVDCFRNWAMTCNPTTCPLCREEWKGPDPSVANAGAGPSFSTEGYQNFAAQAGLSTTRDTSTYYHGPRRRADGGYGRYDSDYYNGIPDSEYGANPYKRWRRW